MIRQYLGAVEDEESDYVSRKGASSCINLASFLPNWFLGGRTDGSRRCRSLNKMVKEKIFVTP